ncbi:hypothetical protein HCA58_12260 [Micromonospora sp. HNM0581]|nr:hypothetical protein [Micromonospora sp. HNM0581]
MNSKGFVGGDIDPTGLHHTENGEDTGDRAYVDTTPSGERVTRIVRRYVPPGLRSRVTTVASRADDAEVRIRTPDQLEVTIIFKNWYT